MHDFKIIYTLNTPQDGGISLKHARPSIVVYWNVALCSLVVNVTIQSTIIASIAALRTSDLTQNI
jgi:hypothetical protein